MVRLKAIAFSCALAIKSRFQFQYGTIKSRDDIVQNDVIHVSIPVWYD